MVGQAGTPNETPYPVNRVTNPYKAGDTDPDLIVDEPHVFQFGEHRASPGARAARQALVPAASLDACVAELDAAPRDQWEDIIASHKGAA